jgi:hypothetical protein
MTSTTGKDPTCLPPQAFTDEAVLGVVQAAARLRTIIPRIGQLADLHRTARRA